MSRLSIHAAGYLELRRALGDDARDPRYIETVHRRGYRFIASVTTTPSHQSERGPANATHHLKPIVVGREEELAQLQKWYAQALEGRRRVVFVAGEPGIGKTMFVNAFLDSVACEGAARIGRGQCVEQYGTGEPYMPVLEALRRLSRDQTGEQIIDLLRNFAPMWLAQMPGLLTREERDSLQIEVQGVTQQRMLREITEALDAMAAESPLILLLEDLHWSDYSTLELISALAQRSESARLMLLGTYRPVEILANHHPLLRMKQELQLHHQCQELRLRLLSEDNVAEYLAHRLFGEQSQRSGKLTSLVHARTDGNPLFMVNMVDYLLDDVGPLVKLREASEAEWAEVLRVHRLDAFESISQMIECNLERLASEEQAVLEGAAVAGGEFSAALVAAALKQPQTEIEDCCTHLARREQFISTQGPVTWPDGTIAAGFRFHHALYQEVLYGRLSVSHRHELHRRIAMREEAGYGDHAAEVANELAHHYNLANVKDKAIQYFQLAGERACRRSAFKEAADAYRRAIETLKTQPESAQRDQRELDLLSSLVQVLQFTKGWNDPESAAVADQARALAEEHNNLSQLVTQVFRRWAGVVSSGDLPAAIALADQLLILAKREGSPAKLGLAYVSEVNARHFSGDLLGAEEYFARGAAFFDAAQREPGLSVMVYGFASINAWMLGHVHAAHDRIKRELTSAGELDSPFQLAFAQFVAAMLQLHFKQPAAAESLADSSITLAVRKGFPVIGDLSRIILGRARASLGRTAEGVALIREGIGALPTTDRNGLTLFLSWLAEAEALDGAIESSALQTVERALEANPVERAFVVDALRIRGELFIKVGQNARAEADFHDAIALAQKLRAKALELRAAMSLSRMLYLRGDATTARNLLAPIYGWFTEGFDTPDLKDAKALLDDLTKRLLHRERSVVRKPQGAGHQS